jgi:hypothetical protein
MCHRSVKTRSAFVLFAILLLGVLASWGAPPMGPLATSRHPSRQRGQRAAALWLHGTHAAPATFGAERLLWTAGSASPSERRHDWTSGADPLHESPSTWQGSSSHARGLAVGRRAWRLAAVGQRVPSSRAPPRG